MPRLKRGFRVLRLGQHIGRVCSSICRAVPFTISSSRNDDLVIATHGRSFWILDDVTPLRQVQAAAAASNVYLYKPEIGYRLYYPDQVDARPPAGQNPPAGVLIDYYLGSVPAGATHARHPRFQRQRRCAISPVSSRNSRAAAGMARPGASRRHAACDPRDEPFRLESAI